MLNLQNMKIKIKIVIQIYLHIKRISKSWLCYLYKICMRKLLSDQETANLHALLKKYLKKQVRLLDKLLKSHIKRNVSNGKNILVQPTTR